MWFQIRRRQWHPTPVLLPGKSRGRRSLEGCSPWGRWGSDMTERLHFHFSLSCVREGNGNPLQCSCLENPRDGGAWWAAICGVTQSQTLLKWLSSSSICCLQETHFGPQNTYRLKMRGWKSIFDANGKQKKAVVAILISDKIDLKRSLLEIRKDTT